MIAEHLPKDCVWSIYSLNKPAFYMGSSVGLKTECGEKLTTAFGKLGYNFCPYCGGKITQPTQEA